MLKTRILTPLTCWSEMCVQKHDSSGLLLALHWHWAPQGQRLDIRPALWLHSNGSCKKATPSLCSFIHIFSPSSDHLEVSRVLPVIFLSQTLTRLFSQGFSLELELLSTLSNPASLRPHPQIQEVQNNQGIVPSTLSPPHCQTLLSWSHKQIHHLCIVLKWSTFPMDFIEILLRSSFSIGHELAIAQTVHHSDSNFFYWF